MDDEAFVSPEIVQRRNGFKIFGFNKCVLRDFTTMKVHKKPIAAYDKAVRVAAVDGEVTLDGPGIGMSMTPRAADASSKLLSDAVEEARRQASAVQGKADDKARSGRR